MWRKEQRRTVGRTEVQQQKGSVLATGRENARFSWSAKGSDGARGGVNGMEGEERLAAVCTVESRAAVVRVVVPSVCVGCVSVVWRGTGSSVEAHLLVGVWADATDLGSGVEVGLERRG